jgi:hyaluronoglucosaminidase
MTAPLALRRESCGIVEGFYGPPWDDEDRRSVIAFLGDCGLGLYVYAPKDDPFHRERWLEPYPADRLSALASLAAFARERSVSFCFAVSPGLSIRYSDAGDFEALLRKISEARRLGVRTFALFLDDIPPELVHAADRERYADLGAAHADMGNRVQATLERGERLLLCPTEYFGDGDSPRLRSLGAALDPAVPILWTGTEVVPGKIQRAQAETYGAAIRRPPFLWDNYPVNDFRRTRLFLGPYEGREPELLGALSGIVLNPMNEAECSKIAIATFAEFLRDPIGYDADAAWRRAIDLLFPRLTQRETFTRFARLSMKSVLRPEAEPPFDPGVFESAVAEPSAANALRVSAIASECASLARQMVLLFKGTKLFREVANHVESLTQFAAAVPPAAHALLNPESDSEDAIDSIRFALAHHAEIGDPHFEIFLRHAWRRIDRDRGRPHAAPETNLMPERGRLAERAIDDDPDVNFWSRAPQRTGDYFTIDFGTAVAATAIRLAQAEKKRPEEYARAAVLEIAGDDGSWAEVARVTVPNLEVNLGGRLVRRARLRLTGDNPNGLLIREFRVISAI